jgi:NAD(P)-dependent dehydrogenase (short-subunit alcohol dehydrogenase family)
MDNLQDPRTAGPQPPFPRQPQHETPGKEQPMDPLADHGEQSYVGHERLKGRKALITGGDSGIGRAVAIAFAREGADVAISYLDEDADAQETAKLIEATGQKVVLIPGDITVAAHCETIIKTTVDALGGLDILINNAAYQMSYSDITHITEQEFDKTFRTNIYAPFFLTKAALPHLKPGSSIINTASIQSYDPSAELLPYAATKGAIANFTKSLSKSLIEKGIRVNAVAPGPIWTPLIPSTFPAEKVSKFGTQAPLGRPGQPAELAPVYVFLASNDASYVTGAIYEVTGGELTN